MAIQHFRAELLRWYTDEALEKHTQVSDITQSMLGSKTEPKLKLKAMETWGVCNFLVYAIRKYRKFLGDQYETLLASGELLVEYVAELKKHDVIMPTVARQVTFFGFFDPLSHLAFGQGPPQTQRTPRVFVLR